MAKTSQILIGFLFVLIVLSANLQMALSARGEVQSFFFFACSSVANVEIEEGCPLDPHYCYDRCWNACPDAALQVSTYSCVPNLLSVGVNGCFCCFVDPRKY
ncbi:hypothetical protein MKW94_004327 [Papaver nudicaule]|uniref:Uncharacterized protein n=1 Tax=Papaver nudicaule TaxID=74823 RepID=A0AA41VQS3_PAPNU|nr:hypothetical protein [Papaver nudicaule]